MLLKGYTQYVSKFRKLSSGHRIVKGQFSFQSQRRATPKNYHTIVLISHVSKVMLKILQVGPQQYMNQELPDAQAGFKKGRGIWQRPNCQTFGGSWRKQENSTKKIKIKKSTSSSLTTLKH